MTQEELILFGERLRNRRDTLGFTQEYVAEKADITPRFYQMIERGEKGMQCASKQIRGRNQNH